MRKLFFTVLLTSLCSFNSFAQSIVAEEEYAVYATILRRIYRENLKNYKTRTSFVFLENTFESDDCSSYNVDKINGLSKDFRQKNKTSAKLTKLFPINYKYNLTSKPEINELLELGENELDKFNEESIRLKKPLIGMGGSEIVWKHFYEKFPDSNGYYQFTRVGFSSNKRFALVCVKREASMSGESMNYVLRKVKEDGEFFILVEVDG